MLLVMLLLLLVVVLVMVVMVVVEREGMVGGGGGGRPHAPESVGKRAVPSCADPQAQEGGASKHSNVDIRSLFLSQQLAVRLRIQIRALGQ